MVRLLPLQSSCSMEARGHVFRVLQKPAIVRGSTGMKDFDEPKSPTTVKTAAIVMIIVAATIVGAGSGILIANQDLLLGLAGKIAQQFPGALATTKSEIPGPQGLEAVESRGQPVSKAIPTGLSSIGAIRYSMQSGSANVAFDLDEMDLVRTGRLDSPERIYIDLQDHRREQGALGRLQSQKTLQIDGDALTRVRISQWESGAMRIVLDLKRSCDFTYQISPGPPSRLIIQLGPRPTSASAPKLVNSQRSFF